jgi:hypothetical protein
LVLFTDHIAIEMPQNLSVRYWPDICDQENFAGKFGSISPAFFIRISPYIIYVFFVSVIIALLVVTTGLQK